MVHSIIDDRDGLLCTGYSALGLLEYICIDLSTRANLPFTFSREHCEASVHRDVSKMLTPYWFKDLQLVFRHIQRAHT